MTKHEKKELKRYRKLGTIEELSHIVEDCKRGVYNLQRFEKLKNRSEKEEAKRPIRVRIPFRNEISGIVSFEQYYRCPDCRNKIMDMTKPSYDRLFAPASCPNCRQKLDWS